MANPEQRVLDAIDALIDEQLDEGEPLNGYDYDDPDYPKCPRCYRDWHGLPNGMCFGAGVEGPLLPAPGARVHAGEWVHSATAIPIPIATQWARLGFTAPDDPIFAEPVDDTADVDVQPRPGTTTSTRVTHSDGTELVGEYIPEVLTE